LIQVRDILALLEAPIISTIVSRAALPAEPQLYANKGSALTNFIHTQEQFAQQTGRFDYGTLEFPFTLPAVAPDKITSRNPFPPGQYHQDTFLPNSNLTDFYLGTLIPLLQSANQAIGSTSVFFHLKNSSTPSASNAPADVAAKYTLDGQLLALMSHRSSIGKVVAESKFLGDTADYTQLIKAKNVTGIRALLTNVTQEQAVLAQAASASFALASAWETAQGADPTTTSAFVTGVQAAVAKTFRNLIDITTQVEIEYLLQRLN
jgi:chorismate mutase